MWCVVFFSLIFYLFCRSFSFQNYFENLLWGWICYLFGTFTKSLLFLISHRHEDFIQGFKVFFFSWKPNYSMVVWGKSIFCTLILDCISEMEAFTVYRKLTWERFCERDSNSSFLNTCTIQEALYLKC